MEKCNRQAVIDNLNDAGCKSEQIIEFIKLLEQENVEEEMKLLENHRKLLLQRIHRENKKLDSLDYLIYSIRTQWNKR